MTSVFTQRSPRLGKLPSKTVPLSPDTLYIHRGLHSFTNIQTLFDFIDLKGGVEMHVQVKLFQKHLFSHQLITHNTTKDFSWKLQAQNIRRTCCVHKLYWMSIKKQFVYTTCSPDALSLQFRWTIFCHIVGYSRLRNKRRGTLINFWKILKTKKIQKWSQCLDWYKKVLKLWCENF